MGDSVYFPDEHPADKKEEKIFSIAPYTYAIRFAAGYALPLSTIEFQRDGIYNNSSVRVYKDDLNVDYFPSFTTNFEIKFGMPEPFDKFSFGLSVDYQYMTIDDMAIRFSDDQNLYYLKSNKDLVTHTLSFFAFLEFRVPIQVGETWIAPYAQFGLGANINIQNNTNTYHVRRPNVGVFFGLGLEYFISPTISLFVEPRWYHNSSGMKFTPVDGSRFDGKLDLSSFNFLLGINFYFGVGKTL